MATRTQPGRFDKDGADASHRAIGNPKIGCAAARSIQKQQLLLQQNGLGDDGTDFTGPEDSDDVDDDMDQQKEDTAHSRIVTDEAAASFSAKLAIRRAHVQSAPLGLPRVCIVAAVTNDPQRQW
jgi:hypothetical protein